MEHQNLQFMKKLVEDGHTVYTQQHQNPNYLKSFGINSITDLPYCHQWTPEEVEYQTHNLNTTPKKTSFSFFLSPFRRFPILLSLPCLLPIVNSPFRKKKKKNVPRFFAFSLQYRGPI